MRTIVICMLALAVLSLCARTSPLPPSFSPRPSHRTSRSSSLSLHAKRSPASTSALETTAETALTAAKKKDWKRPVVITISAIGVAMTVGWNYISAKSFFSNRERYYKEKARLEAERRKPPPKVGDTVCLVQTYTTQDQVEVRKPSQLRTPCYVLGAGTEADGQDSTAAMADGAGGGGGGGVWQGPQASLPPTVGQSTPMGRIPTELPVSSSVAATDPVDAYNSDPGTVAPIGRPLHRRGMPPGESSIAAIDEIAQAATASNHPSPPALSSSSSSSSVTSALSPADQSIPLLPLRSRPAIPIPRTSISAALQTDLHDPAAPHDSESTEDKSHPANGRLAHSVHRWAQAAKSAGAQLSTEDITFGLTVLNTIGNIPSLVMTTINAVYYRGNPKLD